MIEREKNAILAIVGFELMGLTGRAPSMRLPSAWLAMRNRNYWCLEDGPLQLSTAVYKDLGEELALEYMPGKREDDESVLTHYEALLEVARGRGVNWPVVALAQFLGQSYGVEAAGLTNAAWSKWDEALLRYEEHLGRVRRRKGVLHV